MSIYIAHRRRKTSNVLRWGMEKSLFSTSISLHCVLLTLRLPDVISTVPLDCGWLVTLIADSNKRRSLLSAGDGWWSVYDKKPQCHIIVCSDESEAEVTNNKRLHSRYCTIEANYWQTQSIAWPVCNSRATCFFYYPAPAGVVFDCLCLFFLGL